MEYHTVRKSRHGADIGLNARYHKLDYLFPWILGFLLTVWLENGLGAPRIRRIITRFNDWKSCVSFVQLSELNFMCLVKSSHLQKGQRVLHSPCLHHTSDIIVWQLWKSLWKVFMGGIFNHHMAVYCSPLHISATPLFSVLVVVITLLLNNQLLYKTQEAVCYQHLAKMSKVL